MCRRTTAIAHITTIIYILTGENQTTSRLLEIRVS